VGNASNFINMRYRLCSSLASAGTQACVYDSKNSRRSNTYGGSPNASIANLGLKNGLSMIEDEVRVDDFCRQTVLHRLATMIYHIRNWIKYNLTRVEFKFKTAKAYFVRDDKVKPRM